jgi:hypothetical protein
VDWQRFDADQDLNFHVDADADPDKIFMRILSQFSQKLENPIF